ncbi:hypothetical protein [Falsibacillus pallidus]|uniref:hypothetical protein n=1 Tax=Falsibacillus pallidus TaxID=493781 RepID=UPI003D99ED53
MHLELWLDESGDFENDYKAHLNPSLVGGVLIKKDRITEGLAHQIIGKDFVHFNQEPSEYHLEILEKLKNYQTEFVVFQNKERVMIIDSDTTYLNVLAEGIIQLLLQLSAIVGDFDLDIIVATRKNMIKGHGIIAHDEYERRLRERIILGLAKKALTRKNKWKYNVYFDDARTSYKLMLADGVCNAYLTRTSSKFGNTQQSIIEEFYNKDYLFSFYENSVEYELKRSLVEGKLSEVIFECFLEKDLKQRNFLLEVALKRLSDLDEYGQRVQLLAISSKVETLVKIDRSYLLIKPVLIQFQQELFPRLKELNINIPEFHLDIILYLYTLYTHEGSIEAETQDQLFLAELNHVKDIMIKLKYFHLYKLRRSIHQKNMLNVLESIKDNSKAISVFEEIIQMYEVLDQDLGMRQETSLMFEELGKAYGSRGQAYTMLIHQNQDLLQKAIADFDQALKHFSFKKDKDRQYMYKSLAYCEGYQFKNSLDYLFKSCNLEGESYRELIRHIKGKELVQTIFKIHGYFKIMATAKAAGEHQLADEMYDVLIIEGMDFYSLSKKWKDPHPIQFIYWNMANYLFLKGKYKQSMKYLDKAIEICDVPLKQVTIKMIQLGLLAHKILILKKIGKNKEAAVVQNVLNDLYYSLEKSDIHKTVFSHMQDMGIDCVDGFDGEQLPKIIRLASSIN